MTDKRSDHPYQAWQVLAAHELKGRPVEELMWRDRDGLPRKPVYGPEDLEGLSHLALYPGQFPYVRGARATMYANRPWTIRQYAGFSTAEETNAFFQKALAGGQTGLSVAFDLATHRGYDSDHPRVKGDVGKAGVAIDSVADMRRLFQGIPLQAISVSMTMNGAVLPVLAAFIVAAEESGVPQAALSGTIQNDILKEFLVRNTYIYPPEPSLRIVADIIAYTARHMPKFHSISISGYHMQEAGATAVEELAFTLADGLEYVRAALKRGLGVDDFAPRLSFFFGVGMEFFTEIAKLRAARLLWARLMAPFHPQDPQSSILRMHCQTSGVSLTARDPHNNIVRTTIEALAAILGGTQSLHTNAFDEALALPSPEAARIARNTQLILQEETGIPQVADPLGGSYYVERLTADIAAAAEQLIGKIEAAGGMAAAIREGFPKRMIEEAAALRQARIDQGEEAVVGVNRYMSEDAEPPIPVLSIHTETVRATQMARLQELRRTRDEGVCQAALQSLKQAAEADGNLLAASIAAMRARASVGEVSERLAEIFGRYETAGGVMTGVYAAVARDNKDFHKVRTLTQEFAQKAGRRPRILIAKLGQDGHDRGAKMIAAAFADMGFDVDLAPLFQTPQEVARQAMEADVHVVGVSTQAGAHDSLVPELLQELRFLGLTDILVVLGGVIPQKDYGTLYQKGVAAIFGPGTATPTSALQLMALLRARQDAA